MDTFTGRADRAFISITAQKWWRLRIEDRNALLMCLLHPSRVKFHPFTRTFHYRTG